MAMLQQRFGKSFEVEPEAEVTTIVVQLGAFTEVMEYLAANFNLLSDLTAVDRPECFEMVYFLWAVPDYLQLRVKVQVPKAAAEIPTVSNLWPSANVMERETWDLMGVPFTGHPNLKRVLCPDDFEGHPLRKDFVLEKAERTWD